MVVDGIIVVTFSVVVVVIGPGVASVVVDALGHRGSNEPYKEKIIIKKSFRCSQIFISISIYDQ